MKQNSQQPKQNDPAPHKAASKTKNGLAARCQPAKVLPPLALQAWDLGSFLWIYLQKKNAFSMVSLFLGFNIIFGVVSESQSVALGNFWSSSRFWVLLLRLASTP